MLRSAIWIIFVLILTMGIPLPTADRKERPLPPHHKVFLFKLPQTVGAPFQPYVQRFLREGQKYHQNFDVSNLTITFDLEKPKPAKDDKKYVVVGECDMAKWIPTITINKMMWKLYSHDVREMLLYHELSHCILNRDHEDRMNADNQPISIMHSTLFSDWYYHDHRAAYVKELFTVHEPVRLKLKPKPEQCNP